MGTDCGCVSPFPSEHVLYVCTYFVSCYVEVKSMGDSFFLCFSLLSVSPLPSLTPNVWASLFPEAATGSGGLSYGSTGYLQLTLPEDIGRSAGYATTGNRIPAENSYHMILGMSHLVYPWQGSDRGTSYPQGAFGSESCKLFFPLL